MKARIILHDHDVDVDLNEPTIEVSTQAEGFSIRIIGGVGPQGARGYCPVRGTDYWTEADVNSVIAAAVEAVLDAYPAAEEVLW